MKLLFLTAVLWSSLYRVCLAERILRATSLVTCMENSGFSASTFDVSFTPENRTITYDISANVELNGNYTALVTVYAYGIKIIQKTLNPCDMDLSQLCPLQPGTIDIESHTTIDSSDVDSIPGVAYNVPDIDATAYIIVVDDNDGMQACIQASFANEKTVNHTAVKWVTAVIAGIGLLTSAILSMWGNSYTAAHIAANSVLLFVYFQSVVIITMIAVQKIPPIAGAWAQNLAWSMGLIRVKFMQDIFRWYVQSTGGTPTTYLTHHTISILVQKRAQFLHPRVRDFLASHSEKLGKAVLGTASMVKRSIIGTAPKSFFSDPTAPSGSKNIYHNPHDPMPAKILAEYLAEHKGLHVHQTTHYSESSKDKLAQFVTKTAKSLSGLYRRLDMNDILDEEAHSSSTLLVLRGIKRVGFTANIEETSIVMTGFTFFVLICIAIAIVFGLVRLLSMFVWQRRLQYYRTNWLFLLKGTLLRMVFLGFPQLLIWSFWEFVEQDSPAVIVLAVFFLILSLGILAWNSFRMFAIGRRSQNEYNTPAYLLYSDPKIVSKYGFLYTQFSASHFTFIVPILGYIFIKACFISFAQASGKTQALAIFILELAMLVLVSWKRPYMDKATNVINIIACVVMTINAFFVMFFSMLFGQPVAVASIMGVIFFVLNAAFSLILLLYTLITCAWVLLIKNPDSRFKPAKDDRASFIHDPRNNMSVVNGEFTALGEAVRADHDDSTLLAPDENHISTLDESASRISDPFNSEKHDSSYIDPMVSVSKHASGFESVVTQSSDSVLTPLTPSKY